MTTVEIRAVAISRLINPLVFVKVKSVTSSIGEPGGGGDLLESFSSDEN